MKLRRILSCLMALLLVCSLPVSVLADTWYLEDGSITVNAAESGQTVTQGSTSKDDDAPVITQRDSETATTNTVTIKAAENTTAEVTLDGVNINTSGAAVQTEGAGNVTIELDGENTVQSGYYYAGVDKDNTGALVITNTDEVTEEDPGSLTATGGKKGAGIGGGYDMPDASNITITGNAVVTATGGEWGAGIGGGHAYISRPGDGTNITIEENAHVTAASQGFGAGIGGGTYGDGSDITISGNAYVEAVSGRVGAGIGGGCKGDGSNITVSDNAQVKAQGGEIYVWAEYNSGAGAAIGSGGKDNQKPGTDAYIDVRDLDEGWIAKYANDPQSPYPGIPDLSLEGKEVTRVTFRDENGYLLTANEKYGDIVEIDAKAPTCTEDGHEAGFMWRGITIAVTIPATGHNVPGGYTPLNNATCTTLGTMEGYCTDCKTMVTIPDPNSKLKDHTFTTYVPDPENLATCTKDGTKTAVCDVCHKATDTITDTAKGHNMGAPYTTKEPTCQEEGVSRRDCANCDYYETEPIGIVDHSYGDYVSDDNATCTEDGTKTRNCIWCGLPDTVPDPGTMLRHQFTNYVSDGNATCTEDGTKTAKCDHEGCGETDTVTDEGSALGHSFTNYVSDGNATYTEDGTKTAQCDHEGCGETDTVTDEGSRLPFYLVKDESGRRIPYQEQKQGGVLTITVDADFAILTGTLGGMQALKGQGVDTIVFVTSGATSTFAIEDLLAQGSAASTYMLTHDGEAVTFTLGDGTDISKILK